MPPASPSSAPSPWRLRAAEVIAAEPGRVWRALTEPAELAGWWCSHAEVELRAGGRYLFGGPLAFHGAAPEAERAAPGESRNFEILALQAGAELSFRWRLGAAATRVEYRLSPHVEGCEVAVLQTAGRAPFPGWPASSGGGRSAEPDWWSVFLPNLRAHVENGRADLRLDFEAIERASSVALGVSISTFPWVVWRKLTDPRELERWWAEKAEVDLRPGGAFRLGRAGAGPESVLELEEESRLVHDWRVDDGRSGRVEWRIEETEDDTRLSLACSLAPASGTERERFFIHWAAALLDLKRLSERGVSPARFQAGAREP